MRQSKDTLLGRGEDISLHLMALKVKYGFADERERGAVLARVPVKEINKTLFSDCYKAVTNKHTHLCTILWRCTVTPDLVYIWHYSRFSGSFQFLYNLVLILYIFLS